MLQLKTMIRFCFTTSHPVGAYQKSDGEWTVDGVGADAYLDGVKTLVLVTRPYNTSIYFTTDTNECLDRLTNNESDLSTVYLPIQEFTDGYFVPHPLIGGRLQFIAAYNISDSDQPGEDVATVVDNFQLLDYEVYACSFFLLLSFILFIIARIWLFTSISHIKRSSRLRRIMAEVGKIFFYTSTRFKFITALYSMLAFYIMTSFLSVYKTSRVIVDRPFLPKSYQDSLDHESSFAFLYDQISNVSSEFRAAPASSLRGKLWKKLTDAHRENDFENMDDPTQFAQLVHNMVFEITQRNSIFIAAPIIIPLLKSAGCGLSQENELHVIKVFADPSEPEFNYGNAVRKNSPFVDFIADRLLILLESSIAAHGFELGFDQFEATARIAGTSKSHQWKQRVVCDHENAFIVEPEVQAIALHYFGSFFSSTLVIWAIALVINHSQIIRAKRRKSKRSTRYTRRSTIFTEKFSL